MGWVFPSILGQICTKF